MIRVMYGKMNGAPFMRLRKLKGLYQLSNQNFFADSDRT